MCQPDQRFALRQEVDIYEVSLLLDEIVVMLAMVWHRFHILVTEEILYRLCYYDVYTVQLLLMVVLVCEREKFLENTFSM